MPAIGSDGGRVDNGCTLLQVRKCGLRHAHIAVEIGAEGARELRLIDLFDVFLLVLFGGVIDQHVEASGISSLSFTASAQNLFDPISPLMRRQVEPSLSTSSIVSTASLSSSR